MRSSIAVAIASSLALAQARITGISVPDTIKPGSGFNVKILSSNYIQSVYDVAIAFGFDQGDGHPQSLGGVADSFYLGPGQSNQVESFSKWLNIPASAVKGDGVITASLMSLYGVSATPTLSNYNVTVTFGDVTSTNYVSSH